MKTYSITDYCSGLNKFNFGVGATQSGLSKLKPNLKQFSCNSAELRTTVMESSLPLQFGGWSHTKNGKMAAIYNIWTRISLKHPESCILDFTTNSVWYTGPLLHHACTCSKCWWKFKWQQICWPSQRYVPYLL